MEVRRIIAKLSIAVRRTDRQVTDARNLTITFSDILQKVPKQYGKRRMDTQWIMKENNLLYRHTELLVSALFMFITRLFIQSFILRLFHDAANSSYCWYDG